jgi:hypothetical protein
MCGCKPHDDDDEEEEKEEGEDEEAVPIQNIISWNYLSLIS